MDVKGYIESGKLELYVYGLLDEAETAEVSQMARQHSEIKDEIVSIEKAIVNLSTSFSPFLSSENFTKIRQRLALKYSKTAEIQTRTYYPMYIGWAAAILFLLGIGYQYMQLDDAGKRVATAENERTQLQEQLVTAEIQNKASEDALAIVRNKNTSVISLGGQAVSPQSYAKVFYNKATAAVFIDAKGLPEPPQGKVYQVWALKLSPLTPTSIGLLENFTADNQKIFPVDKAAAAEGFGITLEPAGGSASPTMEQLYTLGKV